MKNIDPKTAAKVWDRVQNPPPPAGDAQAILNLVTEELLDAAAYQRLSKGLPAPYAAAAGQLARQAQSQAACLKGIYTLITGRKAIAPAPQVPPDPAEILLRRCYGRQLRKLTQYEARLGDPQYGHVFRLLVRQAQEHCHQLLVLLGAVVK